ncbi:gamma-glutamyltransferase family protein [Aquibacillus albus]|uniref:Gamma-glutamyltranspeptidase/glutathione hydrolase n=1 Tax=Aquibacillus albus TaxID=1168171 RepID=A0ABS2MW72_9BACI|nr:gamma-glutamyltransferase family protein [Aquibacillus albus]MBM7570033.1 gamma-glutamyltranspeptidase/glutathione hydrolase [Aquibacillus albus]
MVEFDPLYNPYPAQQLTKYARKGMVATSQPLAAQAGLEILKKGGNAIDAAIATAISLTVLEPTSNGIGGDAFALVWVKDKLHGLNASGPSPEGISIEAVKDQGVSDIPDYGWLPVTVPGAPKAWVALSERFGKLPFEDLFESAIKYVEEGYAVSPILSKYWKRSFDQFSEKLKGEEFQPWFDTFAAAGRAPQPGEVWQSSDHANTLRLIAESKADAFYKGELADKIEGFAKEHGGFLRKSDLEKFEVEWVDPIRVNYRGYDVWEIPPNGQGINTLMALNMLKEFSFAAKDDVDTVHKQIEAMKLAFSDGFAFVSDPEDMDVTVDTLLSEAYAAQRRSEIGDEASTPKPGTPQKGGTVYLSTADEEGNMVSFIQSNYKGFGSGIVVPGTGIALHNRGKDFKLDEDHVNCLRPGKKSYHTIIPGFLTKNGKAVGPFGVMGGFMQPQGHLQVMMNTIDFRLNPQQALSAPRWLWTGGKTIKVEPNFPDHITQALSRKGHHIVKSIDEVDFGRGQIIWRDEQTGVLSGGTEPRTDGQVAGW